MSLAKSSVIEELSKGDGGRGNGLIRKGKGDRSRARFARIWMGSARTISLISLRTTPSATAPSALLLEDKAKHRGDRGELALEPHKRLPRQVRQMRDEHAVLERASFRHSINRLLYDTDKELSEDSPIIDAQVADARIHAQLKPYALSGAVASIRLGSGKTVGPDYLINKGTTTSTSSPTCGSPWTREGTSSSPERPRAARRPCSVRCSSSSRGSRSRSQ